jgi:F-type H+-transporting ATPase subunit b
MEQTLRQLGELLLASIPTILLLGTLFVLYRVILGRALEQTLAERKARTEGAMAQAKADIAAAEARTAEYEQRLREARATIFQALEHRRQQAMEARAAALTAARAQADQMIREARAAIAAEAEAARARLEPESKRLAEEIIRVVLRSAASAPAGGAL